MREQSVKLRTTGHQRVYPRSRRAFRISGPSDERNGARHVQRPAPSRERADTPGCQPCWSARSRPLPCSAPKGNPLFSIWGAGTDRLGRAGTVPLPTALGRVRLHGPADAPVGHLPDLDAGVHRPSAAADSLAAFLTALHRPAPIGAPVGRDRGGPLADRAEQFAKMLASATEPGLVPDPGAVRAVWEDAAAAPDWAGPALWLHGDLHPANVLTADGALCGVIDFGDLCAGDPACDLAAAWILLPDGAVDRFHDAYQPAPDAATLRRARGWAVLRALAGILIADAGVHGRPGGKPTRGPPARTALRRLTAAARR
ncbi:phosphotransferase [Streptomyces viridosporus]